VTNAYCTLSDVKASLAGDVPNMSSARDQSLVDKILEVSADIDRKVALCRGESQSLFSFLADREYSQQIVYLSSTPVPVSGSFKLRFGGQQTTDLAFDADAMDVQVALEALSTIGSGNVTVDGFPGGPYTVDFAGTMTGPQATITGRASFDVTDAAIVVLPTVQGVLAVPSMRQFRGQAPLYGYLMPIDDCVEITMVTVDGSEYTDYTTYPLRGTPIEAIKRSDGVDWPMGNDAPVEVTARWGYATEVPYDVRETCIIEVIRSHYAGQAGNDDRLGMTPFGTVITAKAFTAKYMALVEQHGKKLW